jgi:DNA-directed RNA polymerase specialized sigma24 family protein
VCRSRALDVLRHQRRDRRHFTPLTEEDLGQVVGFLPDGLSHEADEGLLIQAEQVQAAVRGRVSAQSWEVFWRICVEDQTVREAADALGIHYMAAFRAHTRVKRMLRQEGQRRRNTHPSNEA